jgi:hypothetical protein
VSASNTTDKGVVKGEVYGPNPVGFLTYTAEGRMNAIITNDGRKPLSANIWWLAPAPERAQAYSTVIAYAGRYTVTGEKVIHHIQASTFPNWANTDQLRLITKLQSDQVTLRTTIPFIGRDGVRYVYQELAWDRVQ